MLLSDYLGVFVLLSLGILTGVGALAAANIFGAKRYQPNKLSPYECGIPSEGAENQRYSIKFYLVAVSFILFDIEVIFLVPWALAFHQGLNVGHGGFLLAIGLVFLGVITLGLIYEWRRGLLDWNN